MRIKLFDGDKGFIGEFEIEPTSKILPRVILWGERVFLQAASAEPASYYEDSAAVYRIPGLPPSVLRLGW